MPRPQHGKAQLATWREAFAEKLREQDIEAEVTARRARSVVCKARRRAIKQIEPRRSTVECAKVVEAAREGLAGQRDARPWKQAIAERQRLIRQSYRDIAAELQAMDSPTACALARQVEAFRGPMPAIETERKTHRRRRTKPGAQPGTRAMNTPLAND